jgi:hypothetical protein
MKLFRIADRTDAGDGGGGDGYADGLGAPAGRLEDVPIEVQRYGERTWGVYYNGELLCVTVYLKGARSVKSLIEGFQNELRLARMPSGWARPTPPRGRRSSG